MSTIPLPREFYLIDGLTLAKALLGKLLLCRRNGITTGGIITETEAYMGVSDRASHAYGGRRTFRTETMYLPGGHAYVYLIYGIYSCMNITANGDGTPEAVLIRAVRPAVNFEGMLSHYDHFTRERNRRFSPDKYAKRPHTLTDGPGKLCAAMAIDRALDRFDLTDFDPSQTDDGVTVADGISLLDHRITERPRVGIDYAGEAALYPWRFTLTTL